MSSPPCKLPIEIVDLQIRYPDWNFTAFAAICASAAVLVKTTARRDGAVQHAFHQKKGALTRG